jgi:protocatechuate 3,4-dioxygenase beta subunit
MSRSKSTRLTRREALEALGAAGVAFTVGCSGDTPTSPTSTTSTTSTGTPPPTASTACTVAPTETVGPYPSLGDYVRSDIRDGRPGLPLTLGITVVNAASACAPVANATVDIWQCDASGGYSEYAQGGFDGRGQTFLRGQQVTGADGRVSFTTIYPGWYQGRATHIHVEVTVNGRSVKVTQIAFPEDVTAAVYRTGVYAAKGQSTTSNARDNVFSDSVSEEMATLVGDTTSGHTAAFQVGVSV